MSVEPPVKYVKEKKEIQLVADNFPVCMTHLSRAKVGVFNPTRTYLYVHFDGKQFIVVFVSVGKEGMAVDRIQV